MCEIVPSEMLLYLYEEMDKLEAIIYTIEDELYPESIDVWEEFNNVNP